MDVLTNNNELLKYIETWTRIEPLFNGIALKGVALNKKVIYSKPTFSNEYIRTRINSSRRDRLLLKMRNYGPILLSQFRHSLCQNI